MSENSKPQEKKVEAAPVRAGRLQAGEAHDGLVSTRVPRGVGEPPADAKADDKGLRSAQDAVEKQVREDSEKGYRGQQVSGVDNHAYTVAGVTAGEPTPETVVYTPRGK